MLSPPLSGGRWCEEGAGWEREETGRLLLAVCGRGVGEVGDRPACSENTEHVRYFLSVNQDFGSIWIQIHSSVLNTNFFKHRRKKFPKINLF